jgi:hypothetical protein
MTPIYSVTGENSPEDGLYETEQAARNALRSYFQSRKGRWEEYRDSAKNLQVEFIELWADGTVRSKNAYTIERQEK